MTRARYYALAVLVGVCCLGHTSAFAQTGPPVPAYGGPQSNVDPSGAIPPYPECPTDGAPWYGTADDAQAAVQQHGPIIHFDGAFVRVEYLNYTISKPGSTLLGAPVAGVSDPTQAFPVFDPGSSNPAGFTKVPTTDGINLGNMHGVQVTGGLNLIDDGTIEVSAFVLSPRSSGYVLSNFGSTPFTVNIAGTPTAELVPNSVATSFLLNGQPSNHLLLYNSSYQAIFQSQLWGAEANYLCDVDLADCFHVRPLIGARYINLTERLTQIGVFTAQPDVVTTIDSRSSNNLYGGQIGFRMEVVTKYLEFGVTPKILFLGDSMLSQVSDTHLRSNFDGTFGSQNATSTFTFAGDATSYVQLNLSRCFSIRGGYNLLYINRVTRPQNNIYYNDNGDANPPGIRSQLIMRDVLITGFTVGAQFKW